MNTKHPVQFLLKLVCLIIIIMLWLWQADHAFSLAASLGLLIGSVLLYFPLCYLGRKLLDARPTADRAAQVNGSSTSVGFSARNSYRRGV
jgi:hypothetical protein